METSLPHTQPYPVNGRPCSWRHWCAAEEERLEADGEATMLRWVRHGSLREPGDIEALVRGGSAAVRHGVVWLQTKEAE